MFNKYWFRKFYTTEFVAVITYYADSLHTRMIQAFDNISEEADLVQKETWDRLGRYFDPDRDDPSDYAETAYHVSVDFYIMASNVKQGIVNMFAAGLYHLFEQQLLKLHRQELLTIEESRPPISPDLLKTSIAKQRLAERGIDIGRFRCWRRLEELRLAANTVKHADGYSCAELKHLRPDLFVHPASDPRLAKDLSYHQVVQPLAGEDLFITINQFKEYAEIVKAFWQELETAVEALSA
jgi:hypothetical protein